MASELRIDPLTAGRDNPINKGINMLKIFFSIFTVLVASLTVSAECKLTPKAERSFSEISVEGCPGAPLKLCVISRTKSGSSHKDVVETKGCASRSEDYVACVYEGKTFQVSSFFSSHTNNSWYKVSRGGTELAHCD